MRVKLVALALGAFAITGCGADSANSVVDRIGEGASRLSEPDAGSSLTVSFEPASAAPYTVIFFPDRDVAEAELVEGGADKAVAHRIYTEMAYLGSMAGRLLVAQEGERLQFTSSWKQLADVQPPEDLVVSPWKTGRAAIDLRREDGIVRVVAIR